MYGQPNVELREFLRSRRARVTPAAAGLPLRPGARHVPGLRREEVAQLAGVSVDYYVRLERGRTANVSESVLDAVARALQLNDLESSHLFTLAKASRSRPRTLPPQQVRPWPAAGSGQHHRRACPGLGQTHGRVGRKPAGASVVHRLRRVAPAFPQHGPPGFFRTTMCARSVRTGAQRPKASSPTCACTPAATQMTPRWLNSWGSVGAGSRPPSLVGRPRRGSAHLRGEALSQRLSRRPGLGIRGFHPGRRSRTDAVGVHRATGIRVRRTAESVGELSATGHRGRLNAALRDSRIAHPALSRLRNQQAVL